MLDFYAVIKGHSLPLSKRHMLQFKGALVKMKEIYICGRYRCLDTCQKNRAIPDRRIQTVRRRVKGPTTTEWELSINVPV